MKETRLPKCECLNCGSTIDAASDMRGTDRPKPGDLTICLLCGHLMAFTSRLMVRELTGEERRDVAGDPYILKLQQARSTLMKGGRH